MVSIRQHLTFNEFLIMLFSSLNTNKYTIQFKISQAKNLSICKL